MTIRHWHAVHGVPPWDGLVDLSRPTPGRSERKSAIQTLMSLYDIRGRTSRPTSNIQPAGRGMVVGLHSVFLYPILRPVCIPGGAAISAATGPVCVARRELRRSVRTVVLHVRVCAARGCRRRPRITGVSGRV